MVQEMLEEDVIHETLIRWIAFQLGDEIYGVEVKRVREILRLSEMLPVPGAPEFVLGITNIRGNVVTVVDGRKRINLQPTDYTDATRMIVMESDDDIIAVVVDNVADIIDLPESSIDLNPRLKTCHNAIYIDGVVTHLDELIIILNVEKFIATQQ